MLDENSKIIQITNNITDSLKNSVYNRMFKSQSGRYWKFLYSLTPNGRKELRNYPGITSHGDDIELPKVFTFEANQKQKDLLNDLINDPTIYDKKADTIKQLFNEYNGNLVDYKTSKVLIRHNEDLSLDEIMNVEAPTRELNFMESNNTNEETDEYDYSTDYEDDYYESSDDSDSEDQPAENTEASKETQNDPLANDDLVKKKISNKKIPSNGPLVDNIVVLKEIATVKGYTPEESSMLALNYIDWITEDPNCLIQFNETLKMGLKC